MARIASTSVPYRVLVQGGRAGIPIGIGGACQTLGEAWAEERVAQQGDTGWMRGAAERALAHGDALRADLGTIWRSSMAST